MVANTQLSFLNIENYCDKKELSYFELCLILKLLNRRIHYEIPLYKKVYSVYQYDQRKYMDIFSKLSKLANRYNPDIFNNVNPFKVLKLCYLPDDVGLVPLGDERHIYRYGTLQRVYSRIYDYCGISPFATELKVYIKGLVCYPDEMQAEIEGLQMKSLKTRLRVHIELLRLLRQGVELERAVELCLKQ